MQIGDIAVGCEDALHLLLERADAKPGLQLHAQVVVKDRAGLYIPSAWVTLLARSSGRARWNNAWNLRIGRDGHTFPVIE